MAADTQAKKAFMAITASSRAGALAFCEASSREFARNGAKGGSPLEEFTRRGLNAETERNAASARLSLKTSDAAGFPASSVVSG
jgi:hypothetical protein